MMTKKDFKAIVTADLSGFGHRELDEAVKLLTAYKENTFKEDNFFSDGLTLNFNKQSGYVFLCDEDGNVGLLNDDGEIEQFISCSYCGKEGFKSELKLYDCCGYCGECHLKECVKDEVAEVVKGIESQDAQELNEHFGVTE